MRNILDPSSIIYHRQTNPEPSDIFPIPVARFVKGKFTMDANICKYNPFFFSFSEKVLCIDVVY